MIRHIYPEGYENTELYKLYPELYQAVFIDKRNIYISGPGGTGKSYSIGLIKKECNRLRINCSLTATTGVAAHGLGNGASTIHRWSSINLGDKPAEVITKNIRTTKERSRRWKDTDVLVIDEVSMLGSQILTLIDRVGKDIRIGKRETKKLLSEKMPIPCFGGIQVILSGDFLQLMPIGDDFCFKSPVWNELNLFYFRMTFPYRYPDENHFSLLSRVRVAKHTEEDIEAMRERVKAYEEYRKRERDGSLEESIKPTRIYSLKRDVEAINKVELEKLEGDVIAYEAEDTIIVKTNKEGVPIVSIDNLNTTEYMDYMDSIVDKEIMMKTGSQVLLTKNLSVDDGLVNGSRGVVIGCYDERITVKFKSGAQVDITPYNYEFEDDKVTVIRTQFPLILCWALTTHKIQGSTLDYAIIDIGTSIFSAGQAYVSLSRCRRLKDIMIINVMPEKIKADPEALEFEEKMTKISVLAKPIESISKTGKDEEVESEYPENPGEGSSFPCLEKVNFALLHDPLPRSFYRVAIIGSAGRHGAASEWTPQHFRAMCDAALSCIRQRFQLQTAQVVLVSGGSAWVDHVAVRLFLNGLTADDDEETSVSHSAPFAGLQLYLPCAVQPSDERLQFFDSGSSQWMTNPGRTLNKLHESFSRTAAVASFNDLYVASKMGAKLDCSARGFHARNTLVARNCDFLIAITAGGADFRDMEDAMRRSVPADGGTADTWRKCELEHGRTKIHAPIHLLPLPFSMPQQMQCCSGAANKSSASAAYSNTKSDPSLSGSSSASPSSPSFSAASGSRAGTGGTGELSESDEEGESLSEIVWVDGGCSDLTAPEGWGSVVDNRGRDILCRKDVLPIIKDLKHRVEVLPKGSVSLGGSRTVLISNFADVKIQQNNGAELLAMVAALRLARVFPTIKVIKCDSNLVCLWWSKGQVSKGAKKNIDKEKLALIEECGVLRENFEARGGKIVKVNGSENKADLGMHK